MTSKESAISDIAQNIACSVLVIDDDEAIRMAVSDILATVGIQVLLAAHGEEGLNVYAARSDEIALVLLDYSMPGLDGSETLRRLRKLDAEVPVVVSTGYSTDELRNWEYNGLFQELLPKPYRIQMLIEVVTRHLPTSAQSSPGSNSENPA